MISLPLPAVLLTLTAMTFSLFTLLFKVRVLEIRVRAGKDMEALLRKHLAEAEALHEKQIVELIESEQELRKDMSKLLEGQTEKFVSHLDFVDLVQATENGKFLTQEEYAKLFAPVDDT